MTTKSAGNCLVRLDGHAAKTSDDGHGECTAGRIALNTTAQPIGATCEFPVEDRT